MPISPAGTGIDFSEYELDEKITYGKGNFVQTSVDLARERGWTKRSILSGMALGGRYPLIVGSPTQVADALEAVDRRGRGGRVQPGTHGDAGEL